MIGHTDIEVITADGADEMERDSPLSDGVNRIGIFDSQLAGHAGKVPLAPLYVNIKNHFTML